MSTLQKSLEQFDNVLNSLDNIPYNTLTEKFVPLVVGDLHISDKVSKVHKDYLAVCIDHLTEITNVIREKKVTHVLLLGDLIGRTTERNLQARETLMYLMKVLQTWNALTNNNVYSVRGNHDYATHLTDFEIFVSLGLIKTPSQLDIGSVRFHFVNYGEVRRPLDIHPEFYNVALTHDELHIAGVTSWFIRSKEAVDVETLDNFYGVSLILGGHIHTPSPKMVETQIKDKSVSLMYLGNATLPTYERSPWEFSYGVYFETDETKVEIGQHSFKVPPHDELFTRHLKDEEEEEEELEGLLDANVPVLDVEQLSQILSELNDYNLMGDADYKTQIKRLGGIDKDGVALALEYVEKVEYDFAKK